jgi:predicted house-cleaning NTP pyrophosphatase (Maf/HAM1 superfamily)
MRLTLASSSPRRQALLATLLTDFDTASPDIDERLLPGESPCRDWQEAKREYATAKMI